MSSITQAILPTISGAVIGSLFFSLWLAGLMYFYVSLYGSYSLNFFFGELSIEKPIFLAFIAGLIFGGIQGFLAGLVINGFGATILPKSMLISFIITEVLIMILILFISFDTNPMQMISTFLDKFPDFIKVSIIMLVPSIITGAALTRAISFISSK